MDFLLYMELWFFFYFIWVGLILVINWIASILFMEINMSQGTASRLLRVCLLTVFGGYWKAGWLINGTPASFDSRYPCLLDGI